MLLNVFCSLTLIDKKNSLSKWDSLKNACISTVCTVCVLKELWQTYSALYERHKSTGRLKHTVVYLSLVTLSPTVPY